MQPLGKAGWLLLKLNISYSWPQQFILIFTKTHKNIKPHKDLYPNIYSFMHNSKKLEEKVHQQVLDKQIVESPQL